MNTPSTKLIAVSNRLPIKLRREAGDWHVEPGAGGLVTALAPVLRNRGGLWIGWPGTSDNVGLEHLVESASSEAGYTLRPVMLTEKQVQDYYYGFANRVIWPLFHDFQTRCRFKPAYWYSYLDVNREFARVVAENSTSADYIWIHDYHLMYVAQALRESGIQRKTGFFLHIPFPPVDIFIKLPWRAQVLRAMLEYDLIGFQTMRDRRNFIQCLQLLYPQTRVAGRGSVITVELEGRQVRVGGFPISIDFNAFAVEAGSSDVAERAWYFHESLPNQTIVLGIDRLDYSKGIPQRLEAMGNLFDRYPELQGKLTLVEVVVPSREEVPEYQKLKALIERTVGEINGRFTAQGWVPIHYLYRSLSREELIAYYRTAEVALLTPLKDGMNLVAKEYCACNLEGSGVLILSEFAGAAAQLQKGAIMVNPYDVEGVADALYRAFVMEQDERYRRMRLLRENVRRHDIFWWVDSFLQAGFARNLGDFPPVEEYFPKMEPEAIESGK